MRTKDIFKNRLLFIKREHHWSYPDMAKVTGLPESTIKSYVFRDREPGIYSLAMMSRGFGVTADWLIGLTEERN